MNSFGMCPLTHTLEWATCDICGGTRGERPILTIGETSRRRKSQPSQHLHHRPKTSVLLDSDRTGARVRRISRQYSPRRYSSPSIHDQLPELPDVVPRGTPPLGPSRLRPSVPERRMRSGDALPDQGVDGLPLAAIKPGYRLVDVETKSIGHDDGPDAVGLGQLPLLRSEAAPLV